MEFLPSSSNADDGERERNEKNALSLSRHGFARSPSCHFVSFFYFTSPLHPPRAHSREKHDVGYVSRTLRDPASEPLAARTEDPKGRQLARSARRGGRSPVLAAAASFCLLCSALL